MDRDQPSTGENLGPVARRLAATKRIVCIEDEADIATFLRAYFRASGYDGVHVDPDDVEDALTALAEHEPDAVLLDIRLRGFSGRDVYRRMRSDDRWAFTPVIMVSADTDPELRRADGIDAFVEKPFNSNTLADIVAERLARAEALADEGRDRSLDVLTQRYLEARLADEIALAGARGHFTFALVRLRSLDDVVAEVGHDGRDHVMRQLLDEIRGVLPDDVVIGVSDAGEIAIVLPSCDVTRTETLLEPALDRLSGTYDFRGGASVPVELAAGIASYPYHAGAPDELFMAADAALADAEDAGELVARAL